MKKVKKQNNIKDYLQPYIVDAKKSLLLLLLFTSFSSLMSLTTPLYFSGVIDRVLSSRSFETLWWLTFIALIAVVAQCFFLMVRKNILSSIGNWLQYEISDKLLSIAIHKQSVGIPVSISDGQRDLEIIKDFITNHVATLLDIPWALIFLLLVYILNPIIGTYILIVVIIYLLVMLTHEKLVRKLYAKTETQQIILNAVSDSASNSAESIEAMGMMPNFQMAWEEIRSEMAENRKQVGFYSAIIEAINHVMPIMLRIIIVANIAIMVIDGKNSIGEVIFFMILSGLITAPFQRSIWLYKSWILTSIAYRKINQIMAAEEVLRRGSYELPQPKGNISVENVIYSPPKSAPIIKGVSFALPAGASLSIIGPSAAGKSTLGKVIIGLLAPTNGAVRLDGAETYQWERRNFGKYTGYMPQSIELFIGSIKDNVARMDKNAPLEAVIEACQMADCHDMIMNLPDGYDTKIYRGSKLLSPGQSQRICLARALYGNPKFVLLDEPNINLDDEGEAALIRAIQNIKAAKITLIVVAHRPQVVANLEYMLVLKNGFVERIGATNDVINLYRK
jgi:PrtD family type I secretion system ABC transporter